VRFPRELGPANNHRGSRPSIPETFTVNNSGAQITGSPTSSVLYTSVSQASIPRMTVADLAMDNFLNPAEAVLTVHRFGMGIYSTEFPQTIRAISLSLVSILQLNQRSNDHSPLRPIAGLYI